MVLVGFDCEHAFLPALLEASKNPRIQVGKPGYVDCSKGIIPRDVPKSTDHSEGDVHPYGNPHYMLDPVLAKTAIENIYNALVAFAPQYQGGIHAQPRCLSRQARRQDRRVGEGGQTAQGREVRILSRALAVLRGALRHGLLRHD